MQDSSVPLVSVVIPTYNRSEYLKRAVESVLGQTYENVELIIVDDHSPMPAKEVLSALPLEETRTTHVRHTENRGANAARNSGIEAAIGEFIAFLDDDDRWKPTKLEQQVNVFEESPLDVGVVYCGVQYIDNDGELIAELSVPSSDTTEDVLVGSFPKTFSALMVRSTVIDRAGLPDERFPSWQDLEWCLRLSQHCRLESVAQPLMIRRVGHEGRISEDFEAKRDISYPLFLSKHRPLAAERGPAYERQLVSSLCGMLGWAALRNGYYADARKYLCKSIITQPFSGRSRYLQFLVSIGGKYTYLPARKLNRVLRSV